MCSLRGGRSRTSTSLRRQRLFLAQPDDQLAAPSLKFGIGLLEISHRNPPRSACPLQWACRPLAMMGRYPAATGSAVTAITAMRSAVVQPGRPKHRPISESSRAGRLRPPIERESPEADFASAPRAGAAALQPLAAVNLSNPEIRNADRANAAGGDDRVGVTAGEPLDFGSLDRKSYSSSPALCSCFLLF